MDNITVLFHADSKQIAIAEAIQHQISLINGSQTLALVRRLQDQRRADYRKLLEEQKTYFWNRIDTWIHYGKYPPVMPPVQDRRDKCWGCANHSIKARLQFIKHTPFDYIVSYRIRSPWEEPFIPGCCLACGEKVANLYTWHNQVRQSFANDTRDPRKKGYNRRLLIRYGFPDVVIDTIVGYLYAPSCQHPVV